nr:PREDICTED: kinesin-like protein KIF20B [Latimeria chalumnae]|eukprot:XP_014339534.1 PREDICTED: kinesin-like protein KIF20B [Latimeria chalumnae]
MELLDPSAKCRPSFLEGEEPEKTEATYVEDLKTDLSGEFSSVSSSSDTIQLSQSSVSSSEYLQVYLRVRPFTASELEQNESQDCVTVESSTSVMLKAPKSSFLCRLSDKGSGQMAQRFNFSRVYGPETTQKQFFEGTVKSLIKDFLNGQNSLVFTYGITNAGKTYTFQGSQHDLGILPRSINMLFNSIEGKLYERMDLKPQRCREFCRLTKEQVKEEMALKNSVFGLVKEVDSQSSRSTISSDVYSSAGQEAFEENLTELEQFSLNTPDHVKFSVWISFCEVYNECIYDLLDPISNDKSQKRRRLRLAQDIKGNSYIKDLKWIPIFGPKEACTVLNLGKKHQSIACTKLNSLSSRSHSIFTIRTLCIEDTGVPRVTKVSEFSLCDLAGSERYAKTQNEGERLKEAGNINTSLLILGKCFNALRNNQQSKFQQHVPFRESKLTHYLQGFFCSRGKACMIVNINQCASVYDETLHVLKFSAVAQKVVVLNTSKSVPSLPVGQTSAREVSFIINNADNKMWGKGRKATMDWDMSLEDVMEDEGGDIEEEEKCCTKESLEDDNNDEDDAILISKDEYETLLNTLESLKSKLIEEKKEKLFLELRIRKEVTEELSQHFVQRDYDFSERLEKEKQLLEERSDERLEIYKDLVNKYTQYLEEGDYERDEALAEHSKTLDGDGNVSLKGFIGGIQKDVAEIKKQAEAAHHHIESIPESQEDSATIESKLAQVTAELANTREALSKKNSELEKYIDKVNQPNEELQNAYKKIDVQNERIQQLMEDVQQKDEVINRLQDLLAKCEDSVNDYERTVKTIKEEILKVDSNTEFDQLLKDERGSRKRSNENAQEEQPPKKKGIISTSTELQTKLVCKRKQVANTGRKIFQLKKRKSTAARK